MPDTLCRIAVHLIGPDGPTAVDLVLPAYSPLGELLPSIVEVAFGASPPPRHWYLSHAAGPALDTSLSLRDNDVRDGDMLVLATRRIAAPRRLPTEPCGVVAADAGLGATASHRAAVTAAGLLGAVVSAAALIMCGDAGSGMWPLFSAAAAAVGAAGASVVAGRGDRHVSTMLDSAAAIFAMAAGVLAVPGAPWQAVFLLSSAAALAISMVLLRMAADDAVLAGLAAFSAAAAASATMCLSLMSGPAVAGAALAVVSLGALSVAPKLVVVTAGLGPSRRDVDERRAGAAHRTLTGLVAGWAASAAAGVALAAAAAIHTGSSQALAAALAADVGLLLLLRLRSHVSVLRRMWLAAAGSAALLAAALVAMIVAPAHAVGLCAIATLACVAALRWRSVDQANPMLRQTVQVLEYVALAAVIPLAFWMTGLYGVVREMSVR